ncbi:MAG: methyltransferase domain-containing protein [Limnobacter sp.]|nr:methyltransferase domain-containing protein [Limnobacter sp.]
MQHKWPFISLSFNRWSDNKLLIGIVLLFAVEYVEPFSAVTTASWRHLFQLSLHGAALLLCLILAFRYLTEFCKISLRVSSSTLHLIRSRFGMKVNKAPEPYLEALFDQYADTFESHLVGTLGYCVPEQIFSVLVENIDTHKRYEILDIGCGTGLCGVRLEPFAQYLAGVDLSANMLEKASRRDIYDELLQTSLIRLPGHFQSRFELVAAADVLIYFGDLKTVFETVLWTLKPGGFFIFSIEHQENEDWSLNANGRYAHSHRYIENLALECGLQLIYQHEQVLRTEADQDVQGAVYLVKKSG